MFIKYVHYVELTKKMFQTPALTTVPKADSVEVWKYHLDQFLSVVAFHENNFLNL